MVPAFGRLSPAMARNTVVFPAPEGPTSDNSSPGSQCSTASIDTGDSCISSTLSADELFTVTNERSNRVAT